MKYWAYINNEILGPYEKEKLPELPVFSASTLLCPQTPVGEKTEEWKEASAYPEIVPLLKNVPAKGADAAAGGPSAAGAASSGGAPFEQPMTQSRRLSALAKAIEPTPPPSQSSTGSSFEVSHLGPNRETKKEEFSFASSFDPMTLSQIGKRAVPPENAKAPSLPPGQPPEIFIPAASQAAEPAPAIQTPAPATPEPAPVISEPAPTPVPAQAPVVIESVSPVIEDRTEIVSPSAQAVSGADKKLFEDISAKLEITNRVGATKDDIEVLKEKIGQINEALASLRNNQVQQEVLEKVQRLELAIAEIKEAVAQRAAPPPQTLHIERSTDGFQSIQPRKEEVLSPAEPRAPKKGTETLIVDPADKEKSGSGGVAKKGRKLVFGLTAILALAGGGIFASKFLGGPDLTRFLAFKQAEPQAEPAAPPPFRQGAEAAGAAAQGQDQQAAGKQPQPAQPEPPKKDLSPEIIYIGKQYAAKPGGEILENKIYEDAVFKRGNFKKLDWQVKELPEGRYELTANIPLIDNSGQLAYRYEVDYAAKTVKALDALSQKPLDALLKPARSKQAGLKGRKAPAVPALRTRSSAQRGPSQGQAKAAKAGGGQKDEEYEYVYEDEPGAE